MSRGDPASAPGGFPRSPPILALVVGRFPSFVNLGLRGGSLVFRLLLSFYIVKYLGLDAAGVYGLALGAVGLAPVAASLGVNYFMARDLVGNAPEAALRKLKARFLLSTAVLVVLTGVALAVFLATGHTLETVYVLIAVVVWLEIYANDVHVAMVALEKPFAANVLVAIRLALWVPFVIAAGLLVPAMRSLDLVFAGWIASFAVYAAVLRYVMRDWPRGAWSGTAVDTAWLKSRLRRSWLIFVSDVGMVGFNYVDRYVVSFMLGLTLTGLYTFYWSLTTALQTLIATAIVQLALPTLYKAYSDGDFESWRGEMRRQLFKVVAYGGAIAVAILAGSEVLIAYAGMSELAGNRAVFVMLLLAAILRSLSDLLNIGLMSRHKDLQYTVLNLGSLVLSAGVAAAMIGFFGFFGTGIAALVSASIMTLLRAIALRRSLH